jgi:hypothetical protein
MKGGVGVQRRQKCYTPTFRLLAGLSGPCTFVPSHVVHLKLRWVHSEDAMKRMLVMTLLFHIGVLAGSHSQSSKTSKTSTIACCSKSASDVHVHSYPKKDGTIVKPHTRAHENSTRRDNFSTKDNVNPYTGKIGTSFTTRVGRPTEEFS